MAAERTLEHQTDAALAHDLRNSVAALRLLVEAVSDGVMEANPGSSAVDQMLRHVRMLGALLDTQLNGGMPHSEAAVSRIVCIASLLEQWTAAMEPAARQRDVRLQLDLAPDLPPVRCRPEQISRVLLNLIGSAIRQAPAGGSVVVVRGLQHPSGVQVLISDGGSKPARTGAEAGLLGLTIARAIVHAHGGTLWASAPPNAASLRFSLPAAAEPIRT